MHILTFFARYSVYILPALFAVLIIFAVVNWSRDQYRAQNKKLNACRRKISAYPDKVSKHVSLLPVEYQRQYRAYVNTGASKPSLAFEFVKIKRKVLLLRLLILDAIALSAYIAVFAFTFRAEFLVCQFVFYVAFALIMVIDGIIFRKREIRARQIFARFVTELNLTVPQDAKSAPTSVDKAVEEINDYKKGDVTQTTLQRASELLRGKGLDGKRSVEEQRKLNTALNGLLQAYARNSAERPL